jgi:hypothetical protein
MYSWGDDLRGWCDRDEPVAVALQAAEWIRIVYAELEDWRAGADAHEAHAAENHKYDRIASELSGEPAAHHHRIAEAIADVAASVGDFALDSRPACSRPSTA